MSDDRFEGYRSNPKMMRLKKHELLKSDDGIELERLLLTVVYGPEEDEHKKTIEIRAGRERLLRLQESIEEFLNGTK